MREQTIASSAREVLAVEPVIRRVVTARAANPADVDDLVQDCLERLLVARERLAPEAILPYAVVTARNLVSSHAKSAMRHAAAVPRIMDASEPDRPEEVVLAGEARRAMSAALSQLSRSERKDILAYYNSGPAPGGDAATRGALRVRMSRTRAKLRLEYLLAFRHVELPTPLCHSVLLAISAGDRRRQREFNAAQHLLDCDTCATLSEPLDRRSAALTAITIPVGLVVWTASKVRAHPAYAAVSVTAGSAAAVAAAVFLAPGPVPAVRAQAASPAVRPSSAVISHLSVDGKPVRDSQVQQSIRSVVGDAADASGVSVVTAVTRNGFWVGSAQARIWVELVGPLRPLHIRAGDRVRFAGTMVANPPSYPARAGVTNSADASLLARQGAHITVSTTTISVQRAS